MLRVSLSRLLLLLLLLGQQSSVLHELSHVYYAGAADSAQVSQDHQLPDATQCPTCHGFAQLGHLVGGGASAPAVIASSYLRAPAPSYFRTGAHAPKPRCRGPPQARV
jgi:cytochrome c553